MVDRAAIITCVVLGVVVLVLFLWSCIHPSRSDRFIKARSRENKIDIERSAGQHQINYCIPEPEYQPALATREFDYQLYARTGECRYVPEVEEVQPVHICDRAVNAGMGADGGGGLPPPAYSAHHVEQRREHDRGHGRRDERERDRRRERRKGMDAKAAAKTEAAALPYDQFRDSDITIINPPQAAYGQGRGRQAGAPPRHQRPVRR